MLEVLIALVSRQFSTAKAWYRAADLRNLSAVRIMFLYLSSFNKCFHSCMVAVKKCGHSWHIASFVENNVIFYI